MKNKTNRRKFLQTLSAAGVIGAAATKANAKNSPSVYYNKTKGPNDKIRVAAIGMGIIGFYNMNEVIKLDNIEFVAAADCYDGRLTRCKEKYGKDLITTRDYRELYSRNDIDAVIINTPDHWHTQLAVEAMEAGKHVHIEKPMVQKIPDGHRIIKAQEKTGKVVQVGSEGFRSPLFEKAKSLLKDGAIGQLTMVESLVSRNSGIGAWQYSIPSDASPKTIDWEMFLGPAPKMAFDADRFFRWRKYWDYGTGVSGDMFVHRLSGLHYMLDAVGPNQIMATGGVRYWNDGREAPDVITALLEYPETSNHDAFTCILKANFADGSGGAYAYRFIGSHGLIEINYGKLTLKTYKRSTPNVDYLVNGYNSVFTFAEDQRNVFREEFTKYKVKEEVAAKKEESGDMEYKTPKGYNDDNMHFGHFFDVIRNGGSIIQNPVFGLRACAPTLVANQSSRDGKGYLWNPETMQPTVV